MRFELFYSERFIKITEVLKGNNVIDYHRRIILLSLELRDTTMNA